MQLKRSLAAAAAGLLTGGHVSAQTADDSGVNFDSAVLYYHEQDRVRAIEPEFTLSYRLDEDTSFNAGFIADSLTGATPLGAVPSSQSQTFVRPYKIVALGTPTTVTTASGGSTVVIVPPATGATTQTLAASTVVGPNTLPLDHGFKDTRMAGHAGFEQALAQTLKLQGGIAYSHEHDYRSLSGNLGLSRDFNSHGTTVNLGINYETDTSFPLGGTPTPFAEMSGDWKGPNETKREIDALVGVTQVVTRRWLTSLSYSYGRAHGYQNDPYKIISVVDAVTGDPTQQLYESRPDTRRKQSLYLDNRVHVGVGVLSASVRGFKDDWGIRSITGDLRLRWQLSSDYYLEPHVRYYHQSAADFFRYFLVSREPLPQFASADTRLAAFHSQTYGVKLGVQIDRGSEFNIRLEYYDQHGNGAPADAIGQLKLQNLFPDLKATTVMIGYTYAF